MNSRIVSASRQSVRVQNTRAPIIRTSAARQPSLPSACRRERNAPSRKSGTKRSLRTRKRVIAAMAMTRR